MHSENIALHSSGVSSKFAKLFEPFHINNLFVKNRIIKAPTLTSFANMDGSVNDRIIRHYEEVSKGGAGIIMVEYTYIDDDASKSGKCQLGISRDEHRPGMEWLASTIKSNGAVACLQLVHAGRQKFLGTPPIKTASSLPWEELYAGGAPIPEELTIDEILQIITDFADAALRAKEVGFDMVEIHAAHGYMLTNFLSPKNKRPDWYGGNLNNRMRVLVDLVTETKKKVGENYPLSVRLSARDYQEEDPITLEETMVVARALEQAGVDMIHVSGGDHHTMHYEVSPMYMPRGLHVDAAESIKQAVGVPVVASGSLTTPDLAEEILKAGKADFISLGRPLLADPFWPLKALEGREGDIRPCIRCDECISGRGHVANSVMCSVNPRLGKEGFFKVRRASRPKQIAVVGGGPAGMEAARVASLRGHQVVLFEKRTLGGRLIEAAAPEFKACIQRLLEYLVRQVKQADIKIIEKEFSATDLAEYGFEAVIVAAGAVERILEIPGIERPEVMSYLDALRGAPTGRSVLVIGGGIGGCDAALFLAEQDKEVSIATRMDQIGGHMNDAEKKVVFDRLEKRGVGVMPGKILLEVQDGGAIFMDRSGRREVVRADSFVLASGFTADLKLYGDLSRSRSIDVYAIGDCVRPRKIFDAIHEGFFVGYKI